MAYNKVEICGVDTSRLPVITEAEKHELLRRVREGDQAARERMIRCNLRLVLSVVQRFMGRGECPDDLFQVGCIGLIKSIDRFDPSRDVRFSTYAVPMIIGEVRRHLRDSNPVRVSRSVRDTAYRALQVRERLSAAGLGDPSPARIAEELGLPREEVVLALEATLEPISLYEPVFADSGDTLYVMDQLGDTQADEGWLQELAFREAVAALGEREKRILALRFLRGRTQTEVAAEIGISQAQVSRLEKGALREIKRQLE